MTMQKEKNYYEILGVRQTCSDADIKAAYRQLARKYHPDLGGDVTHFDEICEAYKTLSDRSRRLAFDARLRALSRTAGEGSETRSVSFREKSGAEKSGKSAGAATRKAADDRMTEQPGKQRNDGKPIGASANVAAKKDGEAASRSKSARREELLESQIEQYEDLLLRLSRSAPAQSCPELSPATLCMIIRKNRAERNR